MQLQDTIQLLRDAVSALQNNAGSVSALCQTWRAQAALFSSLPPRFADVAENFLGRLEAGNLFSEESCSFSQQDLLDHLHVWLDQAQLALNRTANT
ncbi:hypothetical protein SAMN04515617_106180 [Collimonas sp. OK242]|jgi:hypothetical protein|uniref:hypothetical protein n=1 Tax=Collimonas sp. OK242 TaxID=1798195 RepID=UPI00089D90E9|nr:hypothetical protein [Collimonas sp. OK242]SDX74991.1 hypothetical protein SAMN04515617_106180 [Collimonas sp. OK242]